MAEIKAHTKDVDLTKLSEDVHTLKWRVTNTEREVLRARKEHHEAMKMIWSTALKTIWTIAASAILIIFNLIWSGISLK